LKKYFNDFVYSVQQSLSPALSYPRAGVLPRRSAAKDAEVRFSLSFYDRSFIYAQITQYYYYTRHLVVPLTLPDDSDDVKDKYALEDIFEAKIKYL
jgi:hypothetical protein